MQWMLLEEKTQCGSKEVANCRQYARVDVMIFSDEKNSDKFPVKFVQIFSDSLYKSFL